MNGITKLFNVLNMSHQSPREERENLKAHAWANHKRNRGSSNGNSNGNSNGGLQITKLV